MIISLFVYLPIPILIRFGFHESAINLEADIFSPQQIVKFIVTYSSLAIHNLQKAIPSQINRAFWF